MSKVKINSGLASVLIVASLFVGWQSLLLVTVLLFAFTDIDEKIKNVAIKVITFYIGLTLFSLVWGLIYDGISLAINSFDDVIAVLNHYVTSPIDVTSLHKYILSPVSEIAGIADNVISYLISFAKVGFLIAIFTGKATKETPISKKISEYVNNALDYVQKEAK